MDQSKIKRFTSYEILPVRILPGQQIALANPKYEPFTQLPPDEQLAAAEKAIEREGGHLGWALFGCYEEEGKVLTPVFFAHEAGKNLGSGNRSEYLRSCVTRVYVEDILRGGDKSLLERLDLNSDEALIGLDAPEFAQDLPADVVITMEGGVIQHVDAPRGLSVRVIEFGEDECIYNAVVNDKGGNDLASLVDLIPPAPDTDDLPRADHIGMHFGQKEGEHPQHTREAYGTACAHAGLALGENMDYWDWVHRSLLGRLESGEPFSSLGLEGMRLERHEQRAYFAFEACRRLIRAYNNGARQGGSMDWEDVDDALLAARDALPGMPTFDTPEDYERAAAEDGATDEDEDAGVRP